MINKKYVHYLSQNDPLPASGWYKRDRWQSDLYCAIYDTPENLSKVAEIGVSGLNKDEDYMDNFLKAIDSHTPPRIDFVPDLDNEYDEFAIAILANDKHIGYVYKDDQSVVNISNCAHVKGYLNKVSFSRNGGVYPEINIYQSKEVIQKNTNSIPPPLPIERPIKATHACPNCKTAMIPTRARSGSFAMEIILLIGSVFFLFAFIPLGLLGFLITFIYSLSRATKRKKVCSNCGNPHMVSLSTNAGQQLQKQLAPQYQNTKYPLPFFLKGFLAFSAICLLLILAIPFLTDDLNTPPASETQPTASQAPTPTTKEPNQQPTSAPPEPQAEEPQAEPTHEPITEKSLITETETHYWYQMPDGTTKRIEKQP